MRMYPTVTPILPIVRQQRVTLTHFVSRNQTSKLCLASPLVSSRRWVWFLLVILWGPVFSPAEVFVPFGSLASCSAAFCSVCCSSRGFGKARG